MGNDHHEEHDTSVERSQLQEPTTNPSDPSEERQDGTLCFR